MRTLATLGTLIAAGGLTLGLMSAPASAVPADSASSATAQQAGDVHTKAWHVKNAKNVSGAPNSKLVCTYVRSQGGTKTHGKACFQPKGDKFWVKDTAADGLNITMRAMPSGNPQTFWDCRDYEGKAAGWTACNFDLKEGQPINFNVIAYKGTDSKYLGITVSSPN
ncbi:hypothetical protein [Streptomyces olivaceiscleroticus]|uniref:Secreted protein n=1 Tax=Streptomyces olivaceiscleroticus TaxID=68245 RepID=A0ABN1B4L6_9ACTN